MIPNFVTQALSREPLTIHGDGSQTRSIQYVDDPVEAILVLMRRPEARPVNTGNPVEYSVRQAAELGIELSGSESELVHKPLPEDDPKQRSPHVTCGREPVGREPRVTRARGSRRPRVVRPALEPARNLAHEALRGHYPRIIPLEYGAARATLLAPRQPRV